jgi:hypothetical protein
MASDNFDIMFRRTNLESSRKNIGNLSIFPTIMSIDSKVGINSDSYRYVIITVKLICKLSLLNNWKFTTYSNKLLKLLTLIIKTRLK